MKFNRLSAEDIYDSAQKVSDDCFQSSSAAPVIVKCEVDTVRNTVTTSINDLSKVGVVIDAATKAGANSVESTSFIIRQDSPAQGEALALATKQAMAKAEAIAQSLNGLIVRVVETHEGGIEPPPLPPAYSSYSMSNAGEMMAEKKTVTTPVEAGSLNVRSDNVSRILKFKVI